MPKTTVIFIPTAGTRKIVRNKGGRIVNFICHLPFMKKWIEERKRKGWTVTYLPRLKSETIARLNVGIEKYFIHPWPDTFIFVTGGQTGKRETGRSSADLMADWLCDYSFDSTKIVSDYQTLQTSEKASALFQELSKRGSTEAEVYVVTSWYHVLRMQIELSNAFRKQNFVKQITFRRIYVFPYFTKECLLYEYLYNVVTEPFKLLLSLVPGFKKHYGIMERKLRGIPS